MGLGCRRGSQQGKFRGPRNNRSLWAETCWSGTGFICWTRKGTLGSLKVRANKQNWWAAGFLREDPFKSHSCYCETQNTHYLSVDGSLLPLGLTTQEGGQGGVATHFNTQVCGVPWVSTLRMQTGFPKDTSWSPRGTQLEDRDPPEGFWLVDPLESSSAL